VNKEICLLLGCGQKGLNWAGRQRNRSILCIDQDTTLVRPQITIEKIARQEGREEFTVITHLPLPSFIIGDAFFLPLKEGSIKRIHADFLLNAISPTGVAFREILDNPAVLQEPPFPGSVKKWYQRNLPHPQEVNLKTISWLLRAAALQQMWATLAEGGEIVIVDKRDVVNWVEMMAPEVLGVTSQEIRMTRLPIEIGDHLRSNAQSLKVLRRYPNVAKKIRLEKVPLS
jgi:hypothetical protein